MVMTAVAPMVRRVEASATTAVLVLVWLFLAPYLIGTLFPSTETTVADWRVPRFVAVGAIWSLSGLWVILDGARARATYGMRKRKLIFSTEDGRALSFLSCSLRILVGIMLLPFAPISLAVGMYDSRNRTIADRLCGTVVQLQPIDRPGYCVGCGYSLYGLPEPRCPECGRAFDPRVVRTDIPNDHFHFGEKPSR